MDSRRHTIAFFTLACALCLVTLSKAQKTYDEQHLEVSLRMIGHQLLLNSADSTSRVLPIQKENGQYRIRFESDFAFNPDELVITINQVIEETEMESGYIVQVEQCETGEVVYSFEKGDEQKKDIFACSARALPKSCYSLLFSFKETEEQLAALNSVVSNHGEKSNSVTSKLSNFLFPIIGLLLAASLFFLWKRRRESERDPNLIPLGVYQFDRRTTELLFEQQRIELTNKEADLLMLLYDAVNTTVERHFILHKVWGDEGDYVGRTLDVFISKLRKKLEADSTVKIVNIRGVGYKLVVSA